MTTSQRTSNVLAGVLGGLVVLLLGAILIATGVIETGEKTREVVRQQPLARPAGNDAEGELTVGDVYDRYGPGVVFVQARGVSGQSESPFGLPQPEGGEGTATGAGFVLDKEGYILTNAHVVAGSSSISVQFGRDDSADAKKVGEDTSTDLALLKVDPEDVEDGLTPLELGSSKEVRVGDPVIAIGNPFGLDRTVTTGIVSALQRQIDAPDGFSISNVIQTDASINPGNSGGPLLDATGKVIGINSQIATRGGGSEGVGFAVPSDTARRVIPQLKRGGEVKRAYLGVTTAPVDEEVAKDLRLPQDEGALVQETVPNGPADDAGLRGGRTTTGQGIAAGGDLIVEVDGKKIRRPEDVAAAIEDNEPGDSVEVEYLRGDDRRTARVKLDERPDRLPGQAEQGGGGGGGGGQDDEGLPFP